tara:strand:- start:380 stop:1663 length:1284 start_codon:yes stop_codon:yes gene_type:complete
MRKCVISSPIATQSGYGHHAREFVKQTIQNKGKEWDIKLLSMPWGGTPFSYPISDDLKQRIIPLPMNIQPDIWVQITVPNEFQRVGKHYNIGVTAGTEGDICPKEWIECINRMDLIIVPSKFTQQVFETTAKNNNLTITTNIQVVSEYFDTNVYNKNLLMETIDGLDDIYEQFCFLFVGHWLQGQVGEDRKNITGMIHTFLDTFKNKQKQPALILKTSGATYSIVDKMDIDKKIEQLKALFPKTDKLPNIYVLHGELTDSEMNSLYNHSKIKAMVSLTKSEGFGRPLLEFTTTGKPVIAPFYSGPTDFFNPEYMIPIPGGLTDIHPSARNQFLIEGAKWFTPNYEAVKKIFKEIVKHYNKYLTVSRKHIKHSVDNFSEWSILKRYIEIFELIDSKLVNVPNNQTLKLPKLNSISKTNKLQLPKLNKV